MIDFWTDRCLRLARGWSKGQLSRLRDFSKSSSTSDQTAKMKINFSNPATGQQKLVDIDDERKVRIFYEKRMSQEVEISALGDEFKGFVVKITGGNDKQG